MQRRGKLSSLVEVRRSPIHGRGVFARKRIQQGQWIGRYLSRRTDRDGRYVLWLFDEDDSQGAGYDGYGRLKFLNHHAEPNSEFDGLELYALRAIEPGEEITIHYGDEWTDDRDDREYDRRVG